MKTLKYKHFLFKESLENNVESNVTSIEDMKKFIIQNIENIEKFKEAYSELDDYDKSALIDDLKQVSIPQTLKDYMLTSFQLMLDDNFRDYFETSLNIKLKKISSYKTVEELLNDPEIKMTEGVIMDMMSKILKKSKEEIIELTTKMLGGVSKFVKSSKDATKITEEDPYGEETWDDMSDTERLYKAFDEEESPN